jgi:hypothetical protein
MARTEKLIARLDRLNDALTDLAGGLSGPANDAICRWQIDAAALRFHLNSSSDQSMITVVLGGTGTGKSTLVNRLVGSAVTAASFRRTFTSGPVAVVSGELPVGWLGVDHIPVAASVEVHSSPSRGQAGALVLATAVNSQLPITIVDTPDLDGDQPINHAQADRAFRWARRIIFVVTPEKYQMTELLPYYRLATRYAVPSLFVMNKCEESAVVEDYKAQLIDRGWPAAKVFVIPRDEAAYDPPVDANLDSLRVELASPLVAAKDDGIANRTADVVARLNDQVLGPMRDARRHADGLIAAIRSMETPSAGVDVNPITQQLQRRLQQRSVLYLVGPQRVVDRVRQMPTLLARLPRATWDWVMRGDMPRDLIDPKASDNPNQPPDFPAVLSDQFTVVRSRIDDALRNDRLAERWLGDDADAYGKALIEPAVAGAIAADEVQQLRDWLEKRWNATPRDTRLLQGLLKHLPGGQKLTKWSEAAPYLLTIALVVHHALFWHIDLPVLGGYTLVTWLTERISNEVSARTRAANRKISQRFERLAHDQIQRVCEWINRQAPSAKDLDLLDRLLSNLAEEKF